mmetsp:Transcript_13549/g.23583  ORF Transcript_13549/g.23583 Transcript_13549/m.23583 type:complete len:313 (+) Transcript_13549:172-1110(+)
MLLETLTNMSEEVLKLICGEMVILVGICLLEAGLPAFEGSVDLCVTFHVLLQLLKAKLAVLVGVEAIHEHRIHLLMAFLNHLFLILPANMVNQVCNFLSCKKAILVCICLREALLPAFKGSMYVIGVTYMIHQLLQAELTILVSIKAFQDRFTNCLFTFFDHVLLLLPTDMRQQGCKFMDGEVLIVICICLLEAVLPTCKSSLPFSLITYMLLELFQAELAVFVGIKAIHDLCSDLLFALLLHLLLVLHAHLCKQVRKLIMCELTVVVKVCLLEASRPPCESCMHMSVVTHAIHELLQANLAILVSVEAFQN